MQGKMLTAIATPLVNLPHWCLTIDEIDTFLSRVVLLEGTSAVKFMLLANVYRRPKMHEVFYISTVVGKRSKLLLQLGLEEWFDIVPRPLKAPKGDVILCDQSRGAVEQKPHCSFDVKKISSPPSTL